MKKYYFLLMPLLAIYSCVHSLYPISKIESDYIFREELLGDWSDNEKDFRCRVDMAENKKYLISVFGVMDSPGSRSSETKIDSSYFEAFLIQYSGQYYLDCSPAIEEALDSMGLYAAAALLPLHNIYKVDILSKDRIVISGINKDSLEKYSSTSGLTIKKDLMGQDNIILTDQPGKLQKNLLQNKKAKFIFSDSLDLTRKSQRK
jgi:hypothetical protein